MKWHTVKITEQQEIDFEKDKPSFQGEIEGKTVSVELEAEKHKEFYRSDADNISVKGELTDDTIKAEMIRSYKLMSVKATVGYIDIKPDSQVITAYDNDDTKPDEKGKDKAQRYFLKVDAAKIEQLSKPLSNGNYITAKGYVIETAKGDRQMNVLGMKIIAEKKQESKQEEGKETAKPKAKKDQSQSV